MDARVGREQWRRGLDAAEVDAVRGLVDAAAHADGVAPVAEAALLDLPLDRAGLEHLLLRGDDGELVGFARLEHDDAGDAAELVVHPARRRRGHGSAGLTALLQRAPDLRVWAHGDLPAARALAGRFDLAVVRELWRMRRDLGPDPLPEPEWSAGVSVRPFVVGADEEQFLAVNNAAFAWHPEQGDMTRADLALRVAEPWFDPAGFLLAVDRDDRVLGFHWTKVHPDGPGGAGGAPIGEVYVLGVDPAARGLRLGRALTLAGLAHLQRAGLGAVMLYVEGDNSGAIRLYQGLGFERWDTDVSYGR